MSYRIKNSDSGKLLLKREGIVGKVVLFVCMGLLFFSIGLFLFSIRGIKESVPFEQIGILFMLFGGICFFAGMNTPSNRKKIVPEEVEFDNENGHVKILQSPESNLVSYIPYNEIQDFYIHIKVETSTNSNTTRSSRTKYFNVRIRKKDKGEWELFSSTSQKKAEIMLDALKSGVKLDKLSSSIPKPVLTDKVSKDIRGQKTIIKWKNKGLVGLLTLLTFAGVFAYTSFFIFSMIAKDGAAFAYVIGGFIVLIFLFVIGINLRKMIRNLVRVYGIAISPHQLEYFEEDNSGMMQKSVVIPTAEIHSISFIFSPSDSTSQVSSLYVYTKSNILKMESIESNSNPISILKDSLSLYTNLISLDLSSLNAVEKLELERWIQLTIKEKSETAVL